MRKQAFLFRIGGLGDLLVALPSIVLARRNLPGFALTLVGRPEYAALLKRAGVVDAVLAFDDVRVTGSFAEAGGFRAGIEDREKENAPDNHWVRSTVGEKASGDRPGFAIDNPRETGSASQGEVVLAIGWFNRSESLPAEGQWARSGIKRGFSVSYEVASGQPISRFFFDKTRDFFSGKIAEDTPAAAPGLFEECARLPVDIAMRGESLGYFHLPSLAGGEKRLVVHPGSGGRAKRWPLDRFLDIVDWAASLGIRGVLVTGEAEGEWDAMLSSRAMPAGWTWSHNPPILALAGLLAGSTHYLGNDSGPTHLAAACGASVLALFRSEFLPVWRPFGNAHLISAQAVDQIPLVAVRSALGALLRKG